MQLLRVLEVEEATHVADARQVAIGDFNRLGARVLDVQADSVPLALKAVVQAGCLEDQHCSALLGRLELGLDDLEQVGTGFEEVLPCL